MANKTIAELTAGTTPDGAEFAHGVQGGNSRKFTFDQLRGFPEGGTALLEQGDLLYVNGDGEIERLPKGEAGQVLSQNAGITAPEWAFLRPRAWFAAKTDVATLTSAAWVSTGLAITAQASRADSAIKFTAVLNGIGGSASTQNIGFRIVRDDLIVVSTLGDVSGSRLQRSSEILSSNALGGAATANTAIQAVDVPGDTAPHTYTVQWAISGGTGYLNRPPNDTNSDVYSRTASTLSALEVDLQ